MAPEVKFVRVDSNISLDVAATLTVNPPTAYRMLKDFVNLQPGMYKYVEPLNNGCDSCVETLNNGHDSCNITVEPPNNEHVWDQPLRPL